MANTQGEADPIASPQAIPCGTINLWGGAMPKSLNMWEDYNSFSAEIMGLLFEPLVALHSTEDRPVGILADKWETSADGKTYTFHINPAAQWSDGQPITAEDVQFYYDVIMNPKHLTPIFKVGLSRFERPKVIDEHTISISAKEAHWGNFWEASGMVAFPKHIWQGKNFDEVRFEFPVVSGPYRLQQLQKDRFLELSRRDDWWGRIKTYNTGKYNFQTIRYRFMEDRTKALEALKKGDFDAYAIYTASIWAKQTDFEAVQKNWVVRQRVFNQEPIGFQGFAINLRLKKFQDLRVRQALALLLNRQLMNEKYMFNQYFLLNSYVPDLFPGNQNPNAPIYSYQPDSARALLAAAGYHVNPHGMLEKDGQIFTITFLTQSEDQRHLAKYVEDLKAVGIDARIERMAWSSLTKRLDEFDYDMYWAAWGASRLRDPEASWFSATADEKGSNNYPGLKDSLVDSLINAQKTEMDLGKRNEIDRAIDTRLTNQLPYILLWQADNHRLLYWNCFGHPASVLDKFNREDAIITYWWYDPAKSKALEQARQTGSPLPAEPADVHWQEP
ncbi:MAG TPA: extracellular solute-binding protein [Fibrobacteraceae bacterium]|nr:extracellular solute-binding protein [Fibrobacteraceae bacterium]